MRTINNMLQSVLKIDLPQAVDNSFDATKKDYVGLQKDQMTLGLASDGEKIGKYQNEVYAAKKNAMNSKAGFGNVDLKLTGDFYSGIFADPRSEGIVVDSLDPKTEMLTEKYGEGIFTLADERKQTFANIAGQILVNEISKQM